MGVLILGVNTLYRLFCFFKLFLMVGKCNMQIAMETTTDCIHNGIICGFIHVSGVVNNKRYSVAYFDDITGFET